MKTTDVKVPALLHTRPVSSQKAWYKANKLPLPPHLTAEAGKSAAEAKRDSTPAPRKFDVRALNAARQAAYYKKGGRQPIGAGGSGGSSALAGSNMSSAKGIAQSIKAGVNPKVSLGRYQGERLGESLARRIVEAAKRTKEKVAEKKRLDESKMASILHAMDDVRENKINHMQGLLTDRQPVIIKTKGGKNSGQVYKVQGHDVYFQHADTRKKYKTHIDNVEIVGHRISGEK